MIGPAGQFITCEPSPPNVSIAKPSHSTEGSNVSVVFVSLEMIEDFRRSVLSAVLVSPGARVAAGQALVVLEAMKMEITLSAAADGTVSAVRCTTGELVDEGRELVTFEDEAVA